MKLYFGKKEKRGERNMKHYRKAAAFLMAVCLAAPGATNVQAATATTQTSATAKTLNGLVPKANGKYYFYVNGKMLKNEWKAVGGKIYYFTSSGAAKTGWCNRKTDKGTYRYYFGTDGAAKTGWCKIGSTSYYFKSNGTLDKSKSTKLGALVTRLDQIIKAQKITSKTTKKSALNKLFAYMRDKCGYDRVIGFTGAKGWDVQYATQMLKTKKGSCYHFSAAFAYLAKRATGYSVRIGYGESNIFKASNWQKHAWVEIKINGVWYTFDPNAAYVKKVNANSVRVTASKCYMQKRSSMINTVYRKAKYVNVTL